MTPDPPEPPTPTYHTFSLTISDRGSNADKVAGRLMKNVNGNWVNVIEFFDSITATPLNRTYDQMEEGVQYRFSLAAPNYDIGLVNPSTEPTTDLDSLIQWVFSGTNDFTLSIGSVWASS